MPYCLPTKFKKSLNVQKSASSRYYLISALITRTKKSTKTAPRTTKWKEQWEKLSNSQYLFSRKTPAHMTETWGKKTKHDYTETLHRTQNGRSSNRRNYPTHITYFNEKSTKTAPRTTKWKDHWEKPSNSQYLFPRKTPAHMMEIWDKKKTQHNHTETLHRGSLGKSNFERKKVGFCSISFICSERAPRGGHERKVFYRN